MTRLHLALTAALLAALVACWPDAKPPPTQEEVLLAAVFDAAEAVAVDSGLGDGVVRWNGLQVRIHEGSDGTGWTPDTVESDAGWRLIFGSAKHGCASHPMPRFVDVASDKYDRTALCHELVAHVARSDFYSVDAGECLGLGDHDYAAATHIDAKCAEAMRGIQTLSGATGGTE